MKLKNFLTGTVASMFIMVLLLGHGCAEERTEPGTAGVFDIQHFLSELELDIQFQERLQEKEQELTEELQHHQQQYQRLLETRLERIGEQPTEEQQQELAQLENQINRQLQNLLQSGRRELQEYQQKLIEALHSELRPYLREIGEDRNLGAVVFRDNVFLLIDEELDVTDEMIAYLRNNPDLLDSLRQAAVTE